MKKAKATVEAEAEAQLQAKEEGLGDPAVADRETCVKEALQETNGIDRKVDVPQKRDEFSGDEGDRDVKRRKVEEMEVKEWA